MSQSAYDAAMAGVEDAKLAVNRAYKNGDISALFGGDCGDGTTSTFLLKKYLYGDTAGEVKIQDTNSNGNSTEQAYTCVILRNELDDYRSTLTSDTRTKVVPLGIGTNQLSNVKRIEVSWYSKENGLNFKNLANGSVSNKKLPNKSGAPTPPALSVTLLRTGGSIELNSFNTSESENYSSMLLFPVAEGYTGGTNSLSLQQIKNAGDSKDANTPYFIKCAKGQDFACNATLYMSSGTENGMSGIENAMLIISMPYGDTVTDFQVVMYDSETGGKPIKFYNVQISVDSTGRANQLVRRVETRLDPADLFFPYPEYEVELTGDGNDSFKKNFWITANCWTDKGICANNGSV